MKVNIIAAIASNNVIGNNNTLPWGRMSTDMNNFKKTTTGFPIIMGRKTFASFGGRALPNRLNIVITRDRNYFLDDAIVVYSLKEAIEVAEAQKSHRNDECFIIGGGEIYKEALDAGIVNFMHLTLVHTNPEGDVKFPDILETEWSLLRFDFYNADEKNTHPFSFKTYEKICQQ